MIWIIQAPDGKMYQVQADGAEQAIRRAQQLLQGKFGATDLAQIIAISPIDAGSPEQQQQWGQLPDVSQAGAAGGDGTPKTDTTSGGEFAATGTREAELAYPEQAYLRGIGAAGYDVNKAFGRALRNRFEPTLANFRIDQLLREGAALPGQEVEDIDFENYSRANTGGQNNLYRRARELFDRLSTGEDVQLGYSGKETKDIFNAQPSTYNPTTQQYEGDEGSGTRAQLLQLARSAAFSKYGGWGGRGPSNEDLNDELNRLGFESSRQGELAGTGAQQGPGVNWAEILKRKFKF